jgi:hypothetical protein
MTNDVRVNDGSSNWLKSKGERPNLFFMGIISQDNYGDDEIMLEMNHDDSKTGAYKRFSFVPSAPSLWIPRSGQYYTSLMIDSITQYPVIPVSFTAGKSGSYKIISKFSLENMDMVLLIDKQTGLTHDLIKENEISILATDSDNPGRFVLQFAPGNYPDPHDQLPVRIYTYMQYLYLDLRLVDGLCTTEIYNMTGAKTFTKQFMGGQEYQIYFPNLQGAFVVSITTDTGRATEKIAF